MLHVNKKNITSLCLNIFRIIIAAKSIFIPQLIIVKLCRHWFSNCTFLNIFWSIILYAFIKNKLSSSVDAIAISKIWNYHWPTDPLTVVPLKNTITTGILLRPCFSKTLARTTFLLESLQLKVIPEAKNPGQDVSLGYFVFGSSELMINHNTLIGILQNWKSQILGKGKSTPCQVA